MGASGHLRHRLLMVGITGVSALAVAVAPASGLVAVDEPGPGPNESGKYGATTDEEPEATLLEMAPEVAADAEVGVMEVLPEGRVLYTSPRHTFTLDDIVGDRDGRTDVDNTNVVIKGDDGETATGEVIYDKSGSPLYPINSTFGFDVKDFVGATDKLFDEVAEEGWAGTFSDDIGSGIQLSDADTAIMKAENLVGTWAAGLGGNEVKASTEHFTTMEAILSCAQTVPYEYWGSEDDWLADEPSIPASADPDVCSANALPNPVDDEGVAAALEILIANEDDIIPNVPNEDGTLNVYKGTDYAVTKKDDGKVLYRWGQAVKRPTDIRFVAHLPLPDEWKTAEGKGYTVTDAQLILRHNVTNNPNDQIRPEDWENEGATGLLPQYTENGTQWLSTKNCYEGDGSFIPAGTVLRDTQYAIEGAPSSDLAGGFSNAWYTSIDRDPFAWAYDENGDGIADVGSQSPDPSLGDLISGPRWRMLPNKFGQDIPGLEIPIETCTPPPYEKGTVKYETGDFAVTTLNLLDWSSDPDDAAWTDAASPLAYSAGWTTTWSGDDPVDGQEIVEEDRCWTQKDGECVTTLGTVLTDDFDVAFYVKGDKKPLKIYDVQLVVEYASDDIPEYDSDFGDAPESYGTDGLLIDGTYLGTYVDAEGAAWVSDDALGDDNNGTTDDEDGVEFVDPFVAGESSEVSITSTAGSLTGYVDFDGNGTFDPGEIVLEETVDSGLLTVDVDVPADAAAGDTFARFIIDDGTGVGEIEDYAVSISGYDYGDAPGTYEQGNPARHLIAPGLAMKLIDADADALSSSDALLDDTTGIDDEDGISIPKLRPGEKGKLKVNATGAGVFNAWFDWNADGTFEQNERVFENVNVDEGVNALNMVTPLTATPGDTFARFRLSSESLDGPTGAASTGEVEDYAILIDRLKGKPAPEPEPEELSSSTSDGTTEAPGEPTEEEPADKPEAPQEPAAADPVPEAVLPSEEEDLEVTP